MRLSRGSLTLVGDAGHRLPLEATDEVARHIRAAAYFVREVARFVG